MEHKLFTSVSIGNFTVPHRVVLAPLTRFRCDESQIPTPLVAEYYAQRASCQGFLIAEATSIHEDAAQFEGSPGIYTEKQVQAWKEVTTRVHTKGAKIFLQLWHVGRATHSSLLGEKQPISSSAVRISDPVRGKYADKLGRRESEIPRALRETEIPEIVNQYVTAAENAIRAGFDGIELHGANGYLIDQFLRDGVNKRTDNYGGTIAKRCRFLLDILEKLGSRIGNDKVGIRFSPFGKFGSMSDSNPVALYTYLLEQLNILHPNLAYIHFTDHHNTTLNPGPWSPNDDALIQLRRTWNGPFILNVNAASRQKAIELIDRGSADLIAIGRDFLANPDLPYRFFKNYPLNPHDPATFYTHEATGYIDYPFYEECNHSPTLKTEERSFRIPTTKDTGRTTMVN